MTGQEQDREALAMAAPECEHYWAWVSPAGTSRSARICQFCHQPDARWLSHTIEVDLGHGDGCLDCEFADKSLAEVVREAEQRAWESGARAGHHSPLTWYALRQCNPYNLARHAGADQ